jgi:hypothetical protein
MNDLDTPIHISLLELATTIPLPQAGRDVVVTVPDAYLSDDRFDLPGVEALAIQRLITLAHGRSALRFEWEAAAASRALRSPAVLPLAAIGLCLSNASHHFPKHPPVASDAVDKARVLVLSHRLGADMFSERQLLVCLDGQRPNLPFDLYEPSTRRLRSEADFESLIDDVVFAQRGAGFQAGRLSNLRLSLAVILRELLENTDDHAKTDIDGSMLRTNAIRGVLVKRIVETSRVPKGGETKALPVPCLEFTVFDSGVGYYDSYRRQLLRGQAKGEPVSVGDKQADTVRRHALGPDVPVDTEYAVVLKCLSRHSDNAIPDPRPGHRGMGLYEVLRALNAMHGMLEVRTGRIHGYRSFLDGELKLQLEPDSSETRPGMPRASLLDVDRKLTTHPAPREAVRGSAVRVVVPLT